MELTGKIKLIRPTQEVSASFKKREFVITTDEQYPQDIQLEFTQDKCDLLNDVQVGQQVTVGINIRGREWINPQGEARYFNTLQAWKIDKGNSAPQQPAYQAPPANSNDFLDNQNIDDLAF